MRNEYMLISPYRPAIGAVEIDYNLLLQTLIKGGLDFYAADQKAKLEIEKFKAGYTSPYINSNGSINTGGAGGGTSSGLDTQTIMMVGMFGLVAVILLMRK